MGGRPPDTTDREILSIFANSDEPVLSTTEIADTLSYSQGGTYKRLQQLGEEGLLRSKMIGDSKAWWLTDSGQRFLEDTDADFATDLEKS
jgi:CTP-dependent riboflavin kinase